MSAGFSDPTDALRRVDEIKVNELYDAIVAGGLLSICDEMQAEADDDAKRSPEKYADPNHPRKYLDHSVHLRKAIRRAMVCGLVDAPQKAILDIGTGAGYFPLVCNFLGHSCEATEVYEGGYLGRLIDAFKIKRHVVVVRAHEKLPFLEHKYDLVTAFEISFSRHTPIGVPSQRFWAGNDWEFLITDIRNRILRRNGRVWFILNAHFGDRRCYDDALLSAFLSLGTKVSGPHVTFSKTTKCPSGDKASDVDRL